MITHIRMKNFKSWQDSGTVKLAPLTGFFGTNSSGKSSLLQMLLLLKQSVGTNEAIFFGDENSLVNLGNFQEVIHGHKEEEILELEFGCKLQKPLTITTIQETDKHRRLYGFAPLDIDSFTFNTAIRGNTTSFSTKHFSYTVGPEAIHNIKWKGGRLSYGNMHTDTANVTNCYGSQRRSADESLQTLCSAFENIFTHVHYLGPARVHSQRYYYWEGTHPENIGQSGEEMIAALLSARVDQLTTPYKERRVPIEDRISAWLQDMDLAYSFSVERTGTRSDRDYDVLIQKGPNTAKVNLPDMGYGLSQFLPVLIYSYYASEGSTLILEQPGMHLHPKVQSQLADLLIEVITERNLQILVESHSEHLLTRLQRRIAEKQIAQDKIALYFCRNNDGASTIEPLEVTESGEIKNWPENFFGDVMGDMFAMTDVQAKHIAEQSSED